MASEGPQNPGQLVASSLASVSVSAVLYGIFMVLFCASVYLMIERRRLSYPGGYASSSRLYWSKDWLILSSLLFVIAITANWTIVVYRSLVAFRYYDHGKMPAVYYITPAEVEVIRVAFWLVTIEVADVMMMYRLYSISAGNKYIVAFPAVTAVATAGSGIAAILSVSRSQSLLSKPSALLVEISWAFSMCTNAFCCITIAWRIYRMTSIPTLRVANGRKASRALSIFVESSTLFIACEILFLITYELGSRGYAAVVFDDGWPTIAGIAFMLINVRVGMGYAVADVPPTDISQLHTPIQPFTVRVGAYPDHQRIQRTFSDSADNVFM